MITKPVLHLLNMNQKNIKVIGSLSNSNFSCPKCKLHVDRI